MITEFGISGAPPVAVSRPQIPAQPSILFPSIPDAARPPDVVEAREKFVAASPNLGHLSVRDARRAQRLVHAALESMPAPQIQVNRRLTNAEAILRSPDPIPTMFDLPESERPHDFDQRARVEEKYDTHGRGADAGRSVYGSVQFADRIHDAAAVMRPDAPKSSKEFTNMGVGYYGPVSLVLKPEVWQRTTVQPGDSYNLDALKVESRPGAVENLADVVAERVVSHFDTKRADGATQAIGTWDQAKAGAALKSILWKPKDQAVEGVRQHLASTAFTNGASMMEAAVRTADRNDIAEIRVMRHPDTEVGSPAHNAIRRLRYHAKKLGIPVHQKTVPASVFPYGSARPETLVKPA
jgi:hypothetical protein